MRVLILGAGSVGQVLAGALSDAGHRPSLLVKPAQLSRAREGFRLRRHREPSRVLTIDAIHTVETARAETWDQVWVTLPGSARAEPSLSRSLEQLRTSSWVDWSPGDNPPLPGGPALRAGIPFLAWSPDPPPEQGWPETWWWLPPLMRVPVSGGDHASAQSLVRLLRSGRLPAVRSASAEVMALLGPGLLMPHVAALELAGWSLRELGSGDLLQLAHRASREALGQLTRQHGRRPPLSWGLLRPLILRWGLRLAPRLCPWDLERYLSVHFTKVGAQTDHMLGRWLSTAQSPETELPALSELAARRASSA